MPVHAIGSTSLSPYFHSNMTRKGARACNPKDMEANGNNKGKTTNYTPSPSIKNLPAAARVQSTLRLANKTPSPAVLAAIFEGHEENPTFGIVPTGSDNIIQLIDDYSRNISNIMDHVDSEDPVISYDWNDITADRKSHGKHGSFLKRDTHVHASDDSDFDKEWSPKPSSQHMRFGARLVPGTLRYLPGLVQAR